MQVKKLGLASYQDLHQKSNTSERLRSNINLHDSFDDPFQRLIVSLQPNSYVVPHRHSHPEKPECFVALQGIVGMILFDDSGRIIDAFRMGPQEEAQVCDIPPGVFHTVIALTPDVIFLEGKPGPYTPIDSADVAPWAPSPGSKEVEPYITELRKSFGV